MAVKIDLYVRSMGKALRVERWYPDTDEGTQTANKAMERDDRLAVVAVADGLILLADRHDKGLPIPRP